MIDWWIELLSNRKCLTEENLFQLCEQAKLY